MMSSRLFSSKAVSGLLLAASAAFTLHCGGDGGGVTVPEDAAIQLSTSSLTFTAASGGAAPAAQTVSITNGGQATLNQLTTSVTYTGGQPTGWLSLSLSGTVAPTTLTATVAPGNLTEGSYTATVAVSSDAANNSPQILNVTFTVTPPTGGGSPAIALSSTSLGFTGAEGGASPAAQTIQVTNAGAGVLDGLAATVAYTAGQPTGWLSATLSGVAAPSTLTITAATGSLAAGTYTATVSISSPTAINSPQAVSVSFAVTAPAAGPLISLSSTTKSFNATAGGANPAAETVQVTNGGGGTLNGLETAVSYEAGQPTGWLSASLDKKTAPSTLTLTATTGTLAAGSYTATVAVSSGVAGNSPQTVNVSFTVAAPTESPSIALSSQSETFSATAGGENPPAKTVQVTNGGTGTLTGLAADVTYTAGQPTGWLTASLSSITAPSTLTLTAATGDLAAGTYTASVNVTSAAAGNSPQAVQVTFEVAAAAPVAPTELSAEASSSSTIDLTWTDNSANEEGFKIERCSGDDCDDFAEIETTGPDVDAFTDTELTAGTSYSYRVRAFNAAGNSEFSNTASATTPGPPTAPTHLTATPAQDGTVVFTWTDNASDEDGFRFEGCIGQGCSTFTVIPGDLPPNATSAFVVGLTPETTYRFRMFAFNENGNSDYSNVVSATTVASGAPPQGLMMRQRE